MPLRHDMRNSTGGVMAAPLCIAAPEPWWLDDDCVPAPVAMSYDILDPARDVRRIEVLREVIGIGRTMGFSRARIVDADDPARVIAISTGTGVSLGDVPPVSNRRQSGLRARGLSRPAFAARRLRHRAGRDGAMRSTGVTPELSSPHWALHIGPINIALEAAAMDELETVDRHRATSRSSTGPCSWSSPVYLGPFRARPPPSSGPSGRDSASKRR